MYIYYDEDEWETVIESGDHYLSYKQVRRSPEEVAKIKAERRRKEEDEILVKAKAILASRGLKSLDEA